MVLKIGQNSVSCQEIALGELYASFPDLVSAGAKFATIPCRSIQGSDGVLYIRQKEDVVTFFGDRFDDGNVVRKLGTQDVLTCHVVTLRHEETGVTAFAHFDEYLRLQRLEAFLSKFYKLLFHRTFYGYEDENSNEDQWEWYDESDEENDNDYDENRIDPDIFGTVTLQLVGGYKEESGKGGLLSKQILSFFSSHPLTFNLTLACLGQVNTKLRGRPEPIVGGVLCDLAKGGQLYPATFNRSFVDGMPEETIMTLMLGPSLLKKPFKLKKMIIEHEDKGFSLKASQAI